MQKVGTDRRLSSRLCTVESSARTGDDLDRSAGNAAPMRRSSRRLGVVMPLLLVLCFLVVISCASDATSENIQHGRKSKSFMVESLCGAYLNENFKLGSHCGRLQRFKLAK
jgi:hypothetical protein